MRTLVAPSGGIYLPGRQYGVVGTSDRLDIGTIAFPSTYSLALILNRNAAIVGNKSFFGSRRGTLFALSVIQCRLSGTSGDFSFRIARATTALIYTTNNLPFGAQQFRKMLITVDTVTPVVHIYWADVARRLVEATYSAQTVGSGAFDTETSQGVTWGNRDSSGYADAWPGIIAASALFRGILPLNTAESFLANPRRMPGQLNLLRHGMRNVGILDESGAGSHASRTGTLLSRGVVLRRPTARPGFYKKPGSPQTLSPAAAVVSVVGVNPQLVASGAASLAPTAATVTVTAVAPSFAASGAAALTPPAAAVAVAAPTPGMAGSGAATLAPTAAAVSVSAPSPAITASGAATLTPAAAPVNVVAVTPALSTSGGPQTMQPAPALVSVTVPTPLIAGSSAVSLAPSAAIVTVVAATPLLVPAGAGKLTPAAASVSVVVPSPLLVSGGVASIAPTAAVVVISVPTPTWIGGPTYDGIEVGFRGAPTLLVRATTGPGTLPRRRSGPAIDVEPL